MKNTIVNFLTQNQKLEKITSFLKENELIVLTLLLGTIGIDVFFIKISSDIINFGILILYALFAKVFKKNSNLTFLICLGLLGVMFSNYLFSGASVQAEKAIVWIFLFMAMGIVQQLREVTP